MSGETEKNVKPVSENDLNNLAAAAARAAEPLFRQAGWVWTRCQVPDVADLAATVQGLISTAVREGEVGDGVTISTGRFHVTRYMEDGKEHFDVSLSLAHVEGPEPTA